jgi:hypothetical protein
MHIKNPDAAASAEADATAKHTMDPLDYWRFCDELSVVQAALLIVGEDPSRWEYVASQESKNRPEGYDAVKTALVNAIRGKRLSANVPESEGIDLPEGPDYLSSFHPNYSAKLAAAIEAWRAVSGNPELRRGKTIKQALDKWLREHANEFGLTKEDGNPNEQGIEEVAKIANWDLKGGAPKSPGNE